MGKNPDGFGTVYRETDANRKTKWRAEKLARLPNGTRKRIIARANTQKEALAKLAKRERSLARANPEAERLELRDYLHRWLDYKHPNVRGSTFVAYEKDLRLHVIPRIGHLPLARVRPLDVQAVLTGLQDAGKHATADKTRRTLKQAFRQAQKWDLLESSPIDKLDPIRKHTPKRGKWEPHQIRAFLALAQDHPYHPLFYTALFTGMRRGELMALQWQDVTPDRIHVRRTYNPHAPNLLAPPKTKAGNRRIPIRGELYILLLEHKQEGSPFVFASRAGTMLGDSNINRAFRAIQARDPQLPRIRFHDLRRIYATYLARKGVQPKVIQQLLGHSTPRMALEAYTDVLQDQEDAAVLTPEDLLGVELGGTTTNHD